MLYFLHGLFEDATRWHLRGGRQVLDGLLTAGEIGEFIVVIPDGGRSFYTNSRDGAVRYEDFLVQELVPFVDSQYRTRNDREHRGISGSSMGGYGALKLGMRYAAVFGSASAHGAVLIPEFPETVQPGTRAERYLRILEGPFGLPFDRQYWEANNPLRLARHPNGFGRLRLYFDCGDRDRYGFNEGAEALHRILAEQKFPHEYHLFPGDHGWAYLQQYLRHSLVFHWKAFNGLR